MLCCLHKTLRETRPSRLSRETFDATCMWRVDLALRFSALWQSSRNDERWTATGHLTLGVIRGQSRARVIPAKYKHELMVELRNAAGQGVRTPRQLVVGLHVARKRGATLRLNLRQRQALPGKRKAKSATLRQKRRHVSADMHASPISGYAFEYSEQYNYFCASRFERLVYDRVEIKSAGDYSASNAWVIGLGRGSYLLG